MEKIISEINSVKKFMAARSNHASCDLKQLGDSFASQLLKLIGKTQLGPGHVAALMDELSTNNPYGSHTDAIIKLLDSKIVDAHDHVNPDIDDASSARQMLHYWWTYPTAGEWVVLLDPQKGFHVKMSVMVHRGRQCGVVNPDEQALKWLLALLMKCHYQEVPPVLVRWKHLGELKSLFETEQKNRPDMVCPLSLRSYPAKAADLPDHILKAAYAADDMPVDKSSDMTGITALALQIPLRKTSRLLRGHFFDDDTDMQAQQPRIKRSLSSSPREPMKVEPIAHIEPVMNAKPNLLAPKLESAHPVDAKFCNMCGHALNHHAEAPCIKAEPDGKDNIRNQLRLNGQLLAPPLAAAGATPPKDEPVKQEPSPRLETHVEPPLDSYAQAAVDALRSRNEKRVEAAKAAKSQAATNSKTNKNEEHDDDDDDEDDDDNDDDDEQSDAAAKKPAAAPSALKKVKKKKGTNKPAACVPAVLKKKVCAVFNPKYDMELSRSAVQCRHGVKASEAGGVIAPRFLFRDFPKGKHGAVNAAKQWVAKFRKTYTCKEV